MDDKRISSASEATTAHEATAVHEATVSLSSSSAPPVRINGRRRIAIAIDESKYAEYTVRWALKYIIKPKDEVFFINCRPVVTLATLYGQPLMDIGDQWKQYIAFAPSQHPADSQLHSSTTAVTSNMPEEQHQKHSEVLPERKSLDKLSSEQQQSDPTLVSQRKSLDEKQVTFSDPEPAATSSTTATNLNRKNSNRRASWKSDDELAKVEQKNMKESKELLKLYCARLIDRKINCRGLALRGDPKEEITNIVSNLSCDFLILGARGQGAATNPLAIPNILNSNDRAASTVATLKRAFPNTVKAVAAAGSLGTVSAYCVAQSTVPVIVVKGPSENQKEEEQQHQQGKE